MEAQPSSEARSYLTAIDLQIASITRSYNPKDDYDYALADLILQLQELRTQLIADSSISSSPTMSPSTTSPLTSPLSTSVPYIPPASTSPLLRPSPSTPLPLTSTRLSSPLSMEPPSTLFLTTLSMSTSPRSISPTSTPQEQPAGLSHNTREVSLLENFPDTSSKRIPAAKTIECSTCLESLPLDDTTTLICCGTVYCEPCLCEWFNTALSSKLLPKCCRTRIDPELYPSKLTKSIVSQHKAVVRELEADRKLWCADMECRAFIEINEDTSGFVQCTKCRQETCASCSASISVHKGPKRTCPDHLTDEVLEASILKNEWKRCPRCHVVVEKTLGCNNVTCTCGAMFCFRCGISKASERDKCKCSHPEMQFDEPAE